ncbi:MAG: trypsin-like peptidase domain-containing protein [Phycisphaerae bacterium]|nr:trypsin-like peptidase domain-containing protein [Phycisphaerae bacterium]
MNPILIAACVFLLPASADEAKGVALARLRALERSRVEMIQRLLPSVVCIYPPNDISGGGSGVVIDADGYGLTNYHVVRSFAGDRVGDGGLSDGKRYRLEVLGLDPTGDVAMFRLVGDRPFYGAPLGDADRLRVGDWTFAMGNPFLLAENQLPTVTLGIVSGLHRYQKGTGGALIYTDCIQVDTSINPGNSGGPLFDLRGELIGINGRISVEDRGRVNVGLGYAITINQIRRFIPALRAGLVVRHGTLGATVRDRALNHVIIDQILTDGAAYRAGLRLGDRVLELAGVPIASSNQCLNVLGTLPERWPITVRFERDGKSQDVSLRLDPLPLAKGLTPPKEVMERFKMKDPFRPNTKANRAAVRRLLRLYRRMVGGDEAIKSIESITFRGRLRKGAGADAAEEAVSISENRPGGELSFSEARGADVERLLRWSLLTMTGDTWARRGRVSGADELNGEIAAVVEFREKERVVARMWFEDLDGRLLRMEVAGDDDATPLRFEYDDYRRDGACRWPHRRRAYAGERLLSEAIFDTVHAEGARAE